MRSINSILKGFNKNITQLRNLAEYSNNEAEVHTANAEENMRKAAVETKTATQASRIADNIEKMISGE
jgi:Sec-independent protein translocase protein TatA